MTEAFVTPQLLRWARERYDLTTDALAQKIPVKAEIVDAWEEGTRRPTFRQAKILASRLYIPFGYLFLSSPPSQDLPIPDLRTVAGAPSGAPSPDFLDLLNDVLAKQEWYRERLENEEAEVIPFIGRFTLTEDAEHIAQDIAETLNITEDMRQASSSWEGFLTEFIRSAEDAGVLVLRSGVVGNNGRRKLNVEEFRGFAISDQLAPLVFINGQDAKSAQIFTLAHELAHLWIGESGVSNPNYREKSSQQSNEVERLCNRVAAETLLPRAEFDLRWQDDSPIGDNLRVLASRYRVSTIVVLRQAYDIGKLSFDTYWSQYTEETSKQRQREDRSRQDGGGNFYNTLLARNSTTLTTALVASTLEGQVSHREAARLLNVQVSTLDGIADRLFKDRF